MECTFNLSYITLYALYLLLEKAKKPFGKWLMRSLNMVEWNYQQENETWD